MLKTITLTTTHQKLYLYTLGMTSKGYLSFCDLVGISPEELRELAKDRAPMISQLANFMDLTGLTSQRLRELLEDLPESPESVTAGQSEP